MFSRIEDVKEWLQMGAVIVDVRTETEFVGFHIPDAIHIAYDEIEQNIHLIRSWHKPLVVYSTYGCRSNMAAIKLQKYGIPALAITRDKLWDVVVSLEM